MSLFLAMALAAAADAKPASVATPIPKTFAPTGEDKRAIEALLATYTRAVSNKDRDLYLTLLLDRQIPFGGIPAKGVTPTTDLRQYERFDRGVFEGSPFSQRFQDVRIEQDGGLANVSLVFVNTEPDGSASWGLKTLQLLKVDGRWRIVSEFFTGHPLSTRDGAK